LTKFSRNPKSQGKSNFFFFGLLADCLTSEIEKRILALFEIEDSLNHSLGKSASPLVFFVQSF